MVIAGIILNQPATWLCGKFEDGKDSGIGAYIVYINGSWKGDDAIGHLVRDLKNPNYQTMHYQELAHRTQTIKDKQEVNKMTEFWQKVLEKGKEEGREEGREEEKLKISKKLISMRMDLSDVMRATGLPLEQLHEMEQSLRV